MLRLLLLLSALSTLVASEAVVVGRANGGTLRPVVPLREFEAGKTVDAMDAKLAEIRALSPAERREREAGMGRSLERLVETCANTKHLNKSLYLLAAWRMSYGDKATVGGLLDRLVDTKYPAYQQAAKLLRVQWLVASGRLDVARTEAEALAAAVPEFAGVCQLVSFHEQLGKPAPRTAGVPVGGAPADPATRSERFLLYHFTGTLDDESLFQLGLYLNEVKRPEYAGVVRLVCVTMGGNPLTAAAAIQRLPGSECVDVLWASPGADGEAHLWAEAWKLPGLPSTVLLGPDRTIIAIQPAPTDLRVLVGKAVPVKQSPDSDNTRPKGKSTPWGK